MMWRLEIILLSSSVCLTCRFRYYNFGLIAFLLEVRMLFFSKTSVIMLMKLPKEQMCLKGNLYGKNIQNPKPRDTHANC